MSPVTASLATQGSGCTLASKTKWPLPKQTGGTAAISTGLPELEPAQGGARTFASTMGGSFFFRAVAALAHSGSSRLQ